MAQVKTIQKHENKTLTSSAVATLQIPAGGKIQSLMSYFLTSAGAVVTEAQVRAEISNIRLTIGGKDVVNCSPTIALDVYEHMGRRVATPAAIAGVVELNLARLCFIDPNVRDALGFGTMDVQSIQLQVTAGTLSAIASVETYTERTPTNENLGAYGTLINYPVSFNSTGQHTMDTLPRNVDSTYIAAFVQTGASGVIYDSELRVNANTLRERVPLNVNKQQLSNNGFDQPAGYFAHFLTDGSLGQRLPMLGVNDLRFITNFTTAPGAGGYGITPLTIERLPANL